MTYDRPPTLKSAMTPFPYSVDAEASVQEAERLMAEHQFNHVPVMENREIVGIVTSRELASVSADAADGQTKNVRQVCVTDVYIADLEEPIESVLLTMANRHIGSVVVTRQGRLAGIFTWIDACRSFGDFLSARHSPPGGDAA